MFRAGARVPPPRAGTCTHRPRPLPAGADSRGDTVIGWRDSPVRWSVMEHPLRRPELLVCAWRKHSLAGADLETLDERHAALARATSDGRRLVHCLRCGAWVVVDPPKPGTGRTLETLDELERPRQGKALRQAIILRVIAIDRAVHMLAFSAVAVAAIAVDRNIGAVHSWAQGMLDSLERAQHGSGGVSAHGFTAALLTRLANLRPSSLAALAGFAIVYAVISGFEAVGLWRERRWAEYLTALATAGFLPIEIHELIKRVTFVRIFAMVVNIAILVYLVWAKHLFGVGGPIQHDEPSALEPLPALADLAAAPDTSPA